jgi:hypothetical protein
MRIVRPQQRSALAAAVAAALVAVPADAAFADGQRLPDAEIFASSTTTLITDPADPRLDERLAAFNREVNQIIRRGGGSPRGSQLLDGVFFSEILGVTTLERSRDFDIDRVSPKELHDIAQRVRQRFQQQTVLSFDYREHRRDPVDAVEVEVPGVSARQLRKGFLADASARERLRGGSVTLDGRLILIAALEDRRLVERFVRQMGADYRKAKVRLGRREFVTTSRSRSSSWAHPART